MTKKFLLLLTLLSSLALTYAVGISVSPARYEISADKGKTVYGEFTVTNDSDSDQIYNTSVENFTAQGETGVPLFKKTNTDVASWLHVDSSVSIAKGEKKTLNFSISVPDDVEAGGHFGAIFLYAKPAEGKDISVAIGTKIGMLILLKVNGNIKLGGDIKDFSAINPREADARSRFYFTDLPINLSYRFTNSGNDRVNPYGVVVIKNTLGLTSEIISANPIQGNVLPQSTRKFDIVWGVGEKEDVPASYFTRAFYQAKHFALGFYTARLTIAYDVQAKKGITESSIDIAKNIESSSMKVDNSLRILVFPWQLFTLSSAFLVFFFFISKRGVKKYNKWIIKQAKLSMQK